MSEDFYTGKPYPKYQYSIFIKNGGDEQLVIRTSTFKELIAAKENINKILEKREQTEKIEFSQPPVQAANLKPCVVEGCQGAMTFRSGVSKKSGKPYKGWFCDASDKHIVWEK